MKVLMTESKNSAILKFEIIEKTKFIFFQLKKMSQTCLPIFMKMSTTS